jgi:membrane-associated protein
MTDLFRLLLDAEEIIKTGGLLLILLIVYLETGVLVFFFLPGDYLLFLAGLFAASGLLNVGPWTLFLLILLAAVLGYYTGFFFGRRVGEALYQRPDTRFFKKKYLKQAEYYFKKYGNNALIISRFLPVVRTFMPVLAGIVQIEIRHFHFANIVGGALWSGLMVLGGYFLGLKFPSIINYVEYIILGFIAISSVTVVWQWIILRVHHISPDGHSGAAEKQTTPESVETGVK